MGNCKSSCWWQQKWTRGAVASPTRTLERGALGHDGTENPVDSCNHRKGIILGLTVQNTPNNQSPVIRSSSVSVRSGSCCCCFFHCSLGTRSNFVPGISSAVGCLRLSLSNLHRVIFPAKVLTEMSLRCTGFGFPPPPSRQSLMLQMPLARKNRWVRIYSVSVFMCWWLQNNLYNAGFIRGAFTAVKPNSGKNHNSFV